jgi:hypothetical protein
VPIIAEPSSVVSYSEIRVAGTLDVVFGQVLGERLKFTCEAFRDH